jgi:hypothetical protein
LKSGKKPTRDQKDILKKMGLRSDKYLVERNTSEKVVFVNRENGKQAVYIK